MSTLCSLPACGNDEEGAKLPPSEQGSPTTQADTSGNASDGDSPSASGGQATNDPSYPPPPKGIKLSQSDKAAYDQARADYDRWTKVVDRLTADPEATKKTYKLIGRRMFKPAALNFWESIQRYDKANIRIVNGDDVTVRWDRPVRVDLKARMHGNPAPVVVWKRCIVRGDSFKVMRGDEEIPQPAKNSRSINKIEVRADSTGTWRATRSQQVKGRC